MNNKLIIGKNSSVVKKIKRSLRYYDFVSHTDLSEINFGQYTKIILFSWSFESLAENKKIIDLIPVKKLIFISSTSIFSLQMRKQWNSYPKNKKIIEDYILSNGGTVMRLGVMQPISKKYNNFIHPYTDNHLLIQKLNSINLCKEKVINLFTIKGSISSKPIMPGFFHNLSLFLPNLKFIRIFFEIINKYFLNSYYYGYSADSLNFFSKNLMIGYGVLGSSYRNKKKIESKIIVSDRADQVLNTNGFKGTILGYNKTGLSKFWHGAFIKKNNNNLYKYVPKIVSRSKIPSKTIIGHITKIIDKGNFFEILSKTKNKNFIFYSSNIILAAGSIENSKLINSLLEKPYSTLFFSDQEWTSFGTINIKEALKMNYIKKIGPFITPSRLLSKEAQKYSSLIEFRPFSRASYDDLSFYNDSTKNIITKLFRQFSLTRINEACFNKFGFSLYVSKISLIGQIKSFDSISLKLDGSLSRKRIDKKIISLIRSDLEKFFATFESFHHYLTSDSQHITGDVRLLKNYKINKLIKEKRLVILGSPTEINLNEYYPTNYYLREIKGL